jgi:rhodanese-related sulfurtransferase
MGQNLGIYRGKNFCYEYAMKAKLILSILLSFILLHCAGTGDEKQSGPANGFKEVTAEQAFQVIQNEKGIIILDVRTKAEFNEGHIKNAVNKDFKSSNFTSLLDTLDKNSPYLLYCRSGNRSSKTLKKMGEMGFKRINHLSKGFNEWEKNGYLVVK